MNKYDIQHLVGQIHKRLQPFESQVQKIINDPATQKLAQISSQIQKLVNDPAIKKAMQNINSWVENQEKIAPHMIKILDDMQKNANYSEALETIPYRQLLRLIVDSKKVEDISLLNLINQDVFQKPILKQFDEINIGTHFKNRKPLIVEAFQLYKQEFYAGC